MTASQIVSEIRCRRRQLKITQSDLAEMSGVSLRTIKAIEKGEANPKLDLLLRVLEPLGLTIDITERVRNE
ncbi:MAG: helix-turn-helix transcriptional regulator [Chitinispirillaceae bacterium]|nr:helix-turn-helix transcriptional regulator [Chitinispirillaceae bacterium]